MTTTQEQLERWAREAGYDVENHYGNGVEICMPYCIDGDSPDETEFLSRFSELVRADERERCAKAAADFLTRGRSGMGQSVAAAIRALP